jgi:hypothetical protein
MKKLLHALLAAALGCASVLTARAQTQIETLNGTITPGNDENYCLLLFEANGIFTTAYLPVEQEYSESTFSVPVTVPVSGPVTEVATVLGVYGGNGGVNDTPLSVVMNPADATAATALATTNQGDATTLAEDEMVGPETFSTTFTGADEVTIFDDLEAGEPANLTDMENFVSANASEFLTLSNGEATGEVEPFAQPDPGYATFDLVVPEPGSFCLLLAGAVAWAGLAIRRCCCQDARWRA